MDKRYKAALENAKDAHDHGLYLSEVGPEFKRDYEDYLLDQLVFFRGVEIQERAKDAEQMGIPVENISMCYNHFVAERETIRHIIKLLGG
jgi:hypothetical protein